MMVRPLVLLAAALIAGAACSPTPEPVACGDIPAGGCPQDSGADVCMDPTCVAIYACVQGKWSLAQKCPPRPADAATADAATDAADAPVPLDVYIDAPPGAYGGPGCIGLEVPDCSLGTGLGCVGATDCCGCQDLWVCQDGGWTHWGQCMGGGLVPDGRGD